MSDPETKPPANFWTILIGLASLVLSGVAILTSAGKTDRDDARALERRLCQLEMIEFKKCEKD